MLIKRIFTKNVAYTGWKKMSLNSPDVGRREKKVACPFETSESHFTKTIALLNKRCFVNQNNHFVSVKGKKASSGSLSLVAEGNLRSHWEKAVANNIGGICLPLILCDLFILFSFLYRVSSVKELLLLIFLKLKAFVKFALFVIKF